MIMSWPFNVNYFLQQDEKAYKVEADIQIAIRGYIVLQCPQCNDAIFQGQRGMFVCHDNPHMPTYRITLSHQTTPLVVYLIQQWVRENIILWIRKLFCVL